MRVSSGAVKPWYVYMVECDDGSLYTGVSNDLAKRFAAHQCGRGAKYFRLRKPLRIVYTEQQLSKSHALAREYAIKQLPKSAKLTLINGELSECLSE